MNFNHAMNNLKQRWLTRYLQAALQALPIVVLTGARQTGKTTLARSLPEPRVYLSLDDLGILGQARTDPDSLLTNRPLTLDEAQRAPELLLRSSSRLIVSAGPATSCSPARPIYS
jgi:predicted AAA+ superfamily ATPase